MIEKNFKIQIRVACLGDSITELSGYPHMVSKRLGNNYVVGNFGACGTSVLLDSESPYIYSEALSQAKNFHPDIAIIMLGTNDAICSFEQNELAFIEDYLMLVVNVQSFDSKPVVWIVKPPPIFGDGMWLNSTVLSYKVIPAIMKVATRANLQVIDVYSALDNVCFFNDGVHPNCEAAKVIAEIVCQAIVSR